MIHLPSFIYLYDGGKTNALNLDEISRYLKDIFKGSEIQIRDEFLNHHLSRSSFEERKKMIDNLAEEIAKAKIRKIEERNSDFEPLPGEIEYEKRRISDPDKKSFGILYNGFMLMKIFSDLISEEEAGLSYCHIIFTDQLFASWDEGDLRYHARVSIYGFPSIISTSGIVEAPAKPREFYLKKQFGIDVNILKQEFAGRYIDYDDPRMTEVMKGYVLQALFYHITGNPFCDDRKCRLFNAHWQEEVIQAQLNSRYEFCRKHQEYINYIKKVQ